jgi:hypothetical protein
MFSLDGDGDANAREQNDNDNAGDALGQWNVGADKLPAVACAGFFLVRHEFKMENHEIRRMKTVQVSIHRLFSRLRNQAK